MARNTLYKSLLVLAFALNLHALAANNLWEDEIFTATFASQPAADVLRWTASDIHPPLYYLLASAFTRLVVPLGATTLPSPVSDWLWRFPSVIAVILTVAVTYRLAGHLAWGLGTRDRGPASQNQTQDARCNTPHSSPTPFIAALLLTFSPTALKYGQEARMHALFMFLAALSTWLLFRALARPERWRRWAAFALATTASIYTMYFGFVILAVQAALVLLLNTRQAAKLWRNKTRNTQHETAQPAPVVRQVSFPLGRFIAAVAAAFILYISWWPVLADILRKRAAVGAIEGGVGSPLSFIPGVIRALGPGPGPVAWGFLLLFGLGLACLARRAWPLAVFSGLWLALPAALPLFLGDPRALQFRYAFVLPIYLAVIAYGVVEGWRSGGAEERRAWSEERGAKNFQPPTSNLQLPTSNFQPPTSNLQPPTLQPSFLLYFTWLLVTFSFIAILGFYNQGKPGWRGAAAYLDEHATPTDIVLTGPLWDEGRFLGYYYRGQAKLLTPAAFVANIERYTAEMRASGARLWAVNRFTPVNLPGLKNSEFAGVVVSETGLVVYEPEALVTAALELARQAVDAAYPWAAAAEAQGVINPDPRTARAAALRALGDALVAAGRPQEALGPYQTAVDIFPGWVGGFIVLAETHEAVGDIPAAVRAYQQAVIYNLKWHGPQADEAAALVAAGDWPAALERYHQITKEK